MRYDEWEKVRQELRGTETVVVRHRASFGNREKPKETRMSPCFIHGNGEQVYGRRTKRVHYSKIETVFILKEGQVARVLGGDARG